MTTFTVSGLRHAAFSGFEPLRSMPSRCPTVPAQGGVYAVILRRRRHRRGCSAAAWRALQGPAPPCQPPNWPPTGCPARGSLHRFQRQPAPPDPRVRVRARHADRPPRRTLPVATHRPRPPAHRLASHRRRSGPGRRRGRPAQRSSRSTGASRSRTSATPDGRSRPHEHHHRHPDRFQRPRARPRRARRPGMTAIGLPAELEQPRPRTNHIHRPTLGDGLRPRAPLAPPRRRRRLLPRCANPETST